MYICDCGNELTNDEVDKIDISSDTDSGVSCPDCGNAMDYVMDDDDEFNSDDIEEI